MQHSLDGLTPGSPLSIEDFDWLQALLGRHLPGGWMNVEMVDGYFAALICAPVQTSTGLRFGPVFGVEVFADAALADHDEALRVEDLLRRHWHTIAATLEAAAVDPLLDYQPLLFEDAQGAVAGNDWARGFLRGTGEDVVAWQTFEHDHPGALDAARLLAAEPEAAQGARFDTAERTAHLAAIAALLTLAYRYFEPLRG